MPLLFVYGTLRRGFINQAARRLHARGQFAGHAVARGQLVHCGRYPGLIPGEGRVRGEVFRVSPNLLRYLDAYEGSEFRRTLIRLHPSGQRAFAYFLRPL